MTDLDNDLVKLLVGVAVTVAFFAGLSVWGRRRGLELVQRWAKKHGFGVVSASRRSFVPYWEGESSKGYQFFRVVVCDESGAHRGCWIRCSDFTWDDPTKVGVIWDDEESKR